MDDLKERLRTMADMIGLCEKISWGQDSAIMREAAARIEQLEAESEGAHMVIASERAEVLQLRRRVAELEASIRWVDEVYPARAEAGGARIETTWSEFNAMQRALGVKVDARIGDQEGRAGHNHKLRVRAQEAEARAEAAEAKLTAVDVGVLARVEAALEDYSHYLEASEETNTLLSDLRAMMEKINE